MAIDAVIERVRPVAEGLRLELAPRWMPEAGYESCPGQPALTVVGARTYEPAVGDMIWGSANHCELVQSTDAGKVLHQYRRLSLTRLQEQGP